MPSYYDWTPRAGTAVATPPSPPFQAEPPWNPPPEEWGEAQAPITGAGHPPDKAPALAPLSFTGCTPSTGSTSAGFTITVTGTGFAPDIVFVVATDTVGNNTSYPDEMTVVSDTQIIATWDPDSFYPGGMSFLLGGYNPPFPGTVTYSATHLFSNTA